jgi:peroxiredoxin
MNMILPAPPRHRIRLLLSIAALLACAAASAATVQVSSPAPDFTLRSVDGPNLRLNEQRGRVVMVNFWATWCGPCRQEMPHLNKLHDKYRDAGFVLLGVNIDDNARAATDLAAKLGLRFPVLLDTDKSVSRLYDLGSMPATVLIDREGRVRYLHRGYREGYELSYDQQVRALLKE